MFKLEGQVKDVCMHCIPISNLIKMWFKTRLNHLNMNLRQIGFSQVFFGDTSNYILAILFALILSKKPKGKQFN